MILIADSGSSKTTWCLLDNDKTIDTFISEGINPYFQDEITIYNSFTKAFLLSDNQSIESVIYYGAGCKGDNIQIVTNALKRIFPNAVAIEVHSDMLGAARSVCGNDSGIVCILGTGSNSCLYDGKNISKQLYSLGFWLGDEGGGGHLGKSLSQYYLRDELPASLKELFQNSFKLDKDELMAHAYFKPNPNRYFASFSIFLSQHKEHPFIKSIIKDSFNAFFHKYVKKYPGGHTSHFVGSVGYHFKDLLIECALENNVRLGNIIKAPMDGIIHYHCNKSL